MRLILSLSIFTLTMILALIAFTYTAIHFPSTMRDLLSGAQHVRDQVQALYLPDNFMVWVDIFLQPNQIVLVGFSIAMRLLLAIVSAFLPRDRTPAPTRGGPAPSETAGSPFSRWG